MTIVYVVLALIAGAVLGYVLTRGKGAPEGAPAPSEAEAEKILAAAKAEAEAIRKDAELKGREAALKVRGDTEEELRRRKADGARREEELTQRAKELDRLEKEAQKKDDEVGKRQRTVEQKEREAQNAATKAEQALADAKTRLEAVAQLTASEAREKLVAEIADEARAAAAIEVKKIEEATQAEAREKAQRIVATAIQRYAGEYVHERTVSVVPLPSDDLKGRLIGREGRNVRALEAATGVDMIIDDTPECITISCFNPVRREVARLAIGHLVADGRIHPTRIEEVVQKAEKEVAESCREAGERAAFDLGIQRLNPELTKLLGGLKFRQSYAQNLLVHSIEVGVLAGAIAAELGLNVKQARRAGLLHDIGKAVDHEEEGPHALVGAQLLKRMGEPPKVCQAVAAHHGDVPHESTFDHIVDAANQLSAQRPGARRETMASYIKRLEDLEKLALGYKGVEKAFALAMGKEVRVIVENSAVSDSEAIMLSKEMAKRIETELQYPGQVRVCVVRETRAVDYAK